MRTESDHGILTVEYISGICVATVAVRELNSGTAEELSTQLLGLLNEGKSKMFVLDFESVRYMESACIGSLVTFVKWLSRLDGKIAIANVSENVRFLFAVTKLDRVFPLPGDVHAALTALGAPG